MVSKRTFEMNERYPVATRGDFVICFRAIPEETPIEEHVKTVRGSPSLIKAMISDVHEGKAAWFTAEISIWSKGIEFASQLVTRCHYPRIDLFVFGESIQAYNSICEALIQTANKAIVELHKPRVRHMSQAKKPPAFTEDDVKAAIAEIDGLERLDPNWRFSEDRSVVTAGQRAARAHSLLFTKHLAKFGVDKTNEMWAELGIQTKAV